MKIAMITGASSGLGREFTRLAAKKHRYDELWVVARRRERLEALKRETEQDFDCKVRVLACDLTSEEALSDIECLLASEQPQISLLINAAGYGKIGSAETLSLKDTKGMVQLNCMVPVVLTKLVIPYMKRGAHIMQVCSTAGFQPFQQLSIYAASKAFLYRYSRALRLELLPKGISVTAVCPYWIKDTEFIGVAEKESEKRGIRHYPLASHKKSVAAIAMHHTMLGLPVSTPGIVCSVHRVVAKFVPSEIMMGIWEILRRI